MVVLINLCLAIVWLYVQRLLKPLRHVDARENILNQTSSVPAQQVNAKVKMTSENVGARAPPCGPRTNVHSKSSSLNNGTCQCPSSSAQRHTFGADYQRRQNFAPVCTSRRTTSPGVLDGDDLAMHVLQACITPHDAQTQEARRRYTSVLLFHIPVIGFCKYLGDLVSTT